MIKLFLAIALLSSLSFAADTSELCQSNANQLSFSQNLVPRITTELTLITWNAHKFEDKNFFYDLKRLSADADVLMVQEAMHSGGWQAAFQSHIPMSFSFFKSFCTNQIDQTDQKATGVMTAARFNLEANQTIVSPRTEPLTNTPKVSGYSQIIFNNQVIHLINTHALNFNAGWDFEAQIDEIAHFVAGLSGPVIWAGDFNTWNPLRRDYLNVKTKALGLTHLIPNPDRRNLILDHIFIRGLESVHAEVLNENSSDHYPVRTTLRLK